MLSVPARGLLLVAVALTGATALAYEVAWTRGLVLVLGSTATTTAVVLAVFVGALGLGARWGGPRADASERPLLLYGVLEIAAAAWALVALGLAAALLGPYATVAGFLPMLRVVLRILVAALVVAPGAFLLGATLPALVRFWVREPGTAGRGTAWLYGVNTLGAVFGTLVTGFWGIEWRGVGGWLALAAGVAALVGAVAVAVGTRARVPVGEASRAEDGDDPSASSLEPALPLGPALVAAALCGGIGLAIEVTGFRILIFFVEGFTATFAAMLAVFILGLGMGSLLLGPWLTRSPRPDRHLGRLLAATWLALMLGIFLVVPLLDSRLVALREVVYAQVAGEASVQAALRWTALAGSAALLLVPAVLLGATFPLCVRWAERAGLSPGRAVGRIYLWNSLGTMAAPFLFAFVVIPLVGLGYAWQLVGLLTVMAGVWMARSVDDEGRARRLSPLAILVVPALWVAILVALSFGADSSRSVVAASHILQRHLERSLIDVRTDAVTTASVVEAPGAQKILYTDDFAAAATGRHYRYMRMLGHLPVLLAKDPKNVMVIAFGTGTTAGAVAAHEEVTSLEVVELSSAVFDLAPHFEAANRNVLADDRTRLVRDDGRNALLLHDADLDVITLEPLMPYSPAGLLFYTREFYELAMSRLRDGGVLCQWVPVHAMPAGLYAAFVQTFFEACPDGSIWFFEQSSALIAVKGEGADRETFARRAGGVQADLAAAGFARPELLLSAYVASGAKVRNSVVPPSAFTGRTVRDLDPYPEFHPTPRAPLSTSYLQDTLAYLWTLTSAEDLPPYVEAGSREALRLREGTARGLMARGAEAMAFRARTAGDAETARKLLFTAGQEYGRALSALPGESVLRWRRARVMRRLAAMEVSAQLREARQAREEGREGEATAALRRALALATQASGLEDGDAVASERWRSALVEAAVLRQLGRCESAKDVLVAAREAVPDGSVEAAILAASLSMDGGRAVPLEFRALFADAPPCVEEGLALVERPLERWRAALERGEGRPLRLAADNLYQAARQESLLDAVAAAVREDRPSASSQAVWAVLLVRLDPNAPELGDRLESPDVVAEAGRARLLRRYPEAVDRLTRHEDAGLRARFADAAADDGDATLLRRVVDLLLDENRSVRMAALAALVRHHPAELAAAAYDPDAPEPRRREAAESVRSALR